MFLSRQMEREDGKRAMASGPALRPLATDPPWLSVRRMMQASVPVAMTQAMEQPDLRLSPPGATKDGSVGTDEGAACAHRDTFLHLHFAGGDGARVGGDVIADGKGMRVSPARDHAGNGARGQAGAVRLPRAIDGSRASRPRLPDGFRPRAAGQSASAGGRGTARHNRRGRVADHCRPPAREEV